jgi:hypothetical protein
VWLDGASRTSSRGAAFAQLNASMRAGAAIQWRMIDSTGSHGMSIMRFWYAISIQLGKFDVELSMRSGNQAGD